MYTWKYNDDAGVWYTTDGRYDLLPGEHGGVLRVNEGTAGEPWWVETTFADARITPPAGLVDGWTVERYRNGYAATLYAGGYGVRAVWRPTLAELYKKLPELSEERAS